MFPSLAGQRPAFHSRRSGRDTELVILRNQEQKLFTVSYKAGIKTFVKEKIILIAFGLILGSALAGAAYYVWQRVDSAGKRFSSLEEFHKTMTERDDRDLKSDRSVSLRSIIKPNLSEKIMYELRPNLEVKFQGVKVRTNSYGMRSPEIQAEREKDSIYRVALLGDSFAFGWGVDQDKNFAAVIEKELNRLTGGCPKVEVLNFGVPGYSTFQEVYLLKEKGMQFTPDAVIVYFVNNDYYLPFFISDIHNQGKVVTSQNFSEKFWSKKDDKVTEQHDLMAKMLDPNKMIRKLGKMLDSYGGKVFLAINPGSTYQKDKGKLWIMKKRKYKPEFIPLKKPVENLVAERKIIKKDLKLSNDPHPSALKHQLLGEIMAESLISSVKESSRAVACH